MKNIKILFSSAFFIMMLMSFNIVFAGYQELNSIDYTAKINPNGSVNVVETWDIYVSDTNTLFKTFEIDNSKYSKISNVTVSEVNRSDTIQFNNVGEWQYHVDPKGYYAEHYNGMFEIGWHVGLENSRGTRKYVVSYTIEDCIRRGNDYAEFYWQFIGNSNTIPVSKIKGTVYLPGNASSKDLIKIWGHTPSLNGEIHATDLNKVTFNGKDLSSGNMFEVRVLFPAEMTNKSLSRSVDRNILEEVLAEETKWANQANVTRFFMRLLIVLPFVLSGISFVIFIVLSIKATVTARKVEKKALEKYSPTQKLDYYRDYPDDAATPAEALAFITGEVRDIRSSDFGNIFSANILNLNLKGVISYETNSSKSNEDKIKILIPDDLKKISKDIKLSEDERFILKFLKDVKLKYKEITPKTIQKYMKQEYEAAYDLKVDVELNTYKLFRNKGMYDGDIEENKELENSCLYFLCVFTCFSIFSFLSLIGVTLFLWPILIMIIFIIIEKYFEKRAKKNFSILTKKGIDEQEKWKAFKRYMEEYSLLHERGVQEVALWEKYLVYATAFGTAKKVLKYLEAQLPNVYKELANVTSSNTYIINHNFATYCSNGFNSAMRTKTAIDIAASSSSGSGGGGGFSGGGGGRRWPEAAWVVVNSLE